MRDDSPNLTRGRGHALLPSQGSAWNPIARKQFTGAVFCPPRMSEIAVMRCWEYQQSNGCGVGCKNAVRKEMIDFIMSRGASDAPRRPSEACGCGARKSPQAKGCMACRQTRKGRHWQGRRDKIV